MSCSARQKELLLFLWSINFNVWILISGIIHSYMHSYAREEKARFFALNFYFWLQIMWSQSVYSNPPKSWTGSWYHQLPYDGLSAETMLFALILHGLRSLKTYTTHCSLGVQKVFVLAGWRSVYDAFRNKGIYFWKQQSSCCYETPIIVFFSNNPLTKISIIDQMRVELSPQCQVYRCTWSSRKGLDIVWPSNSLELKTMDYFLWSILERKFSKRKCDSEASLKTVLACA